MGLPRVPRPHWLACWASELDQGVIVRGCWSYLGVLGACMVLLPGMAWSQTRYPERIGPRDFIADNANLITPEDEQRIRAVCERLLDLGNIPFIVVTINSMAEYGTTGWTIERYAHNLFDEWGIGHADQNFGVLLLVSKSDRKVRIEMGAGWSRDRDAAGLEVINTEVVPRFKSGRFSEGIVAGVQAFAARIDPAAPQSPPARSPAPAVTAPANSSTPPTPARQTPARPTPPPASDSGGGLLNKIGPALCPVAAVGMAVLLWVLLRGKGGGFGGARGYGPHSTGGGSGLLTGRLLGQMLGGRSHGGGLSGLGGISGRSGGGLGSGGGFGGGGFSGGSRGSFGGGFSGRGGATGSW